MKPNELYGVIFQKINVATKINESMKSHTTFRIGGAADVYAQPKDENELISLISFANEHNVPYYVIGNGSDLLVSDEGIEGIVICTKSMERSMHFDADANTVTCSCSVMLPCLVSEVIKNGYMGLEWACGIPGTVGGAIAMNAGAHGGEIKNSLCSLRVLENGEVKNAVPNNDDLGYRKSTFAYPNSLVLSATFAIERDDGKAAERRKELMRIRGEKQPLTYPSAGSTFLRPEVGFAGKYIEDAGLKGAHVGDAYVSSVHAGFIVNMGNATAKDVIELIALIKNTVFDNSGIMLKEEIKLVGRGMAK